MKKILIIANYQKSQGGISGQVDILLEKFNKGHFNSTLFNTKTSNFRRIFLIFNLFYISRKYDILHIHGCSGLGFYPIIIGGLVGKIRKKKIIVTYHGGGLKEFLKKNSRLIKYFLRDVSILTVPSPYLHKFLLRNNIKAILLPNIIRTDNVTFKHRDKFLPKLIVTRSLEPVYNIPLVIHAFAAIKNRYPEASLKIVGDGSLKNKLLEDIEQLRLKGIEFLGRVDNSYIGEILNTADIFINPTTADNMPLSLFEAFACGLPVISTNVGGIPDFILDKKNGLLIDNNDREKLIEQVFYVLDNPDKMKTIALRAFESYKKFTWDFLEDQYNKLYQ